MIYVRVALLRATTYCQYRAKVSLAKILFVSLWNIHAKEKLS